MTNTLAAAIRQQLKLAKIAAVASGLSAVSAASAQQAQQTVLPVPCISGSCGGNAPSNWISSGNATATFSGNTLTVNQQSDRAILNWRSFNISADGVVKFAQPDTTSVALNRIFQNDPSVIRGALTANGQIYLINQNGILFGQGAQINTHSLIASTLNITDEVFGKLGLTGAISQNTPAFAGTSANGAITVESGATLSSAEGGRIMLFAPQVENRGTITTPGGQAVLAASKDKIYLANSGNNDLRGLLVEVDTGGSVSNFGSITAERGNVSMLGFAVNQSGTVRATTSVNLNGSIRLMARDKATIDNSIPDTPRAIANHTGTLTLGENSSTEVLPDRLDEKATDSQDQPESRIELIGRSITLQTNAQITAPSGVVALTATANPASPGPSTLNAENDSRVVLERGSSIDVTGLRSAVLPMESNELKVELRGSQLQDAPLQRDGALRNQTIVVDVRKGTPLANISGELAARQRTLEERLAGGGAVSIVSEGQVQVDSGASVDFSGGQVEYLPGVMHTTQLLSQGQIVDIGVASPDVVYSGIFGSETVKHSKWGVTETFGNNVGRFETGYVEGKDAGSVSFNARTLDLHGELRGEHIVGAQQRNATTTTQTGIVRNVYEVPLGGQIVLGNPNSTDRDYGLANVMLRGLSDFGAIGVNRLAVYSNETIVVPREAELSFEAGGELRLVSGKIDFAGTVISAGTKVTLDARETLRTPATTSTLRLRSGAVLDVGGAWVNDTLFATPGEPTDPLFIRGGSISLKSNGDLALDVGSRIDVSGGAQVQRSGSLRAGVGGDVSIASDVSLVTPPTLTLNGEISGYSLGDSGTLTLKGAGFFIGDASSPHLDNQFVLAPTLFSSGGFDTFNIVATHGGIRVGDNVVVEPRLSNLLLRPDYLSAPSGSDIERLGNVGELPDHLRNPVSLSFESTRVSGVAMKDAFLQIGHNSVLRTETGGAINLVSDSRLLVDGIVDAPGGTIVARIAPSGNDTAGFDSSQAIWLQSSGQLLARGAIEIQPEGAIPGSRNGKVFDGGGVRVAAERGYFIAETGSLIDVSATHATLDVPVMSMSSALQRVDVYGDAGTIDIGVAEGSALNGELRAIAADASGASGGTLRVAINPGLRAETTTVTIPFPVGPREIVLSNSPLVIGGLSNSGAPSLLNGLVWLNPSKIAAGGFASLELQAYPQGSPLQQPVYESARIRFDGDVSLSLPNRLVLDAPIFQSNGGKVDLQANWLRLGTSVASNTSGPLIPTAGLGVFNASASQVDLIGGLTLRGFGLNGASSIASEGDLRLQGIYIGRLSNGSVVATGKFGIFGDLNLRANQIYGTTLTDYTIAVSGANAHISVLAGDAVAAPLSAGSKLTLSADFIEQSGTLRAPFGEITLDAKIGLHLNAGSITSASSDGLLVPFGNTQFGEDLIYELGAQTGLYNAPPQKSVTLKSPEVQIASGSIIDISGGGDLLAREFLPGPGGSSDVLEAAKARGAFAVVPAQLNSFGVIDPLLSKKAGIMPGDTIIFAGDALIPAGEYAVLPPGYALLPGAFLITPTKSIGTAAPSPTRVEQDGTTIVSARRGVNGVGVDSLWNSFVVENGAQVRRHSEFVESRADEFLSQRADDRNLTIGRLNRDAGRLQIEAGQSLTLQGALRSNATGGRGAEVDISATRLAVIPKGGAAPAGQVAIIAEDINRLGAESVLIGGTRKTNSDGNVAISVSATDVRVAKDAALQGPELLLAATRTVSLEVGATVNASGSVDDTSTDIALTGDSALIRASSGAQVTVIRTGSSGANGVIAIADSARLFGSSSLTLDAAKDTTVDGELSTNDGSISLAASRIALGDAPGGGSGLKLTGGDLDRFNARELKLLSASTLDIYGSLNLTLDQLVLNAAGIAGYGGADQRVQLTANNIKLGNPTHRTFGGTPTGLGNIALVANEIAIDDGVFNIRGFKNIVLDASGDIIGSRENGTAELHAAGELTLRAARITALGGMDMLVDTANAAGVLSGGVSIAQSSHTSALAPISALGSQLQLAGTSIQQAGNIELPSGRVEFHSTGADGLLLGSGSTIDVSGRNLEFGDIAVGSPGGFVALSAEQGNIAIARSARIDVSGATMGGEGGELSVAALTGNALIDAAASLKGGAKSDESQGRFALTTNTLADGFSNLNTLLNNSGFTEAREIRVKSGTIAIAGADVVSARTVTLTADGGAIDVAGRINASAEKGGRVDLNARDNLVLRSTARIDAHATGEAEEGGYVSLSTVAGALDLQASIDVSGRDERGAIDNSGRVVLRAPRVGAASVGVVSLASRIDGAESVELEAFKTYSANTVDSGLMSAIATDTASYMASAASIKSTLGQSSNPLFHLRPGVEIRSNGSLSINERIDFYDAFNPTAWRYGSEPGVLTLRAAGTLNVNADVSDGVGTNDLIVDLVGATREGVVTGASWSLNLIGGADLSSANRLATKSDAGDVILAAGARVRTGTGDIQIASGRDIRFGDAASAIYTVGINRGPGALPALPDVGFTSAQIQELLYFGDFLEQGGDVRIQAARDMVGVNGKQLFSEWLPRVGGGEVELVETTAGIPASWAVAIGNFQQTVGALGGGDVKIVAGRDSIDVSAVTSTTAQPTGKFGGENAASIAGGGDIELETGRDILGGVFLVSDGSARIRAGRSIANVPGQPADAVFGLNHGSYEVVARKDLEVGGVVNSTLLPVMPNQFLPGTDNYFFTYGADDGVKFTSIAGDVRLRTTDLTRISDEIVFPASQGELATALSMLPGSLSARSLQGSIVNAKSYYLVPSATGNLELLAGKDIGIPQGESVQIIIADADPESLPQISSPTKDLADAMTRLTIPNAPGGVFHASVPVHQGDHSTALIVAKNGSVGVPDSNPGNLEINSAKQLSIVAGKDVRNLRLRIQHANEDDVSTVSAGGDVIFPILRNPTTGVVQNQAGFGFDISGPGQFTVVAASDVNLGSSEGIRSQGDIRNPALPDGGANLTILAGLGHDPDYASFVDAYLGKSEYAEQLSAFLGSRSRPPTLAAFKSLPIAEQRELIVKVFFLELRKSGVAATAGSNDYSRGFAAIKALFPATVYDGDIKSFLSQIATLDGGTINLLAPGGLINAGVASATGITKSAAQLGVTAQRDGDINGFADGNFLVNQSRVFALDGGDIMLWSSRGNIDAGRGAKTALAIPPPKTTIDALGNVVVEFPPAISGSGIRGAVSTQGRKPGDIYLFAPAGVVDAGDAGITSAGNLTIGATAVLGADNIKVGGISVGVPVETGGLGSSLAGVSAAASSASNAATSQVAQDQAKEGAAPIADTAMSWLEVFVIGLGEDTCKQDDLDCLKKQKPANN